MSSKTCLESLNLLETKTKAKGRYLVSRTAIPAGQTILKCKPLSYAITNEKQTFVCHSCLREFGKLMACGKCKYAHYCCRQCQINDWKNHKKECGWMSRLMNKEKAVNSLVIIIRMAYEICTHESVASSENGIIRGDYTDLLDHCDNLEITEPSILEKYNEVVEIIYDTISPELWYNKEVCMKSVILSLIGRLYNNRFAISNYQDSEIAVGMYPIAYLMNHSCNPNVSFVFDGVDIILRSIVAIKANDEICISYTDIAKPSYLRNQLLKQGYSFQCSCDNCRNIQRDKELLSYKCTCGGIQYPVITMTNDVPMLWICEKCGKEGSYSTDYHTIIEGNCYDLLIWLQTEDGYNYKKARQLYNQFKEKCTESNYLFIHLLKYLLTYFIAMNKTEESEEISQTLLHFAEKYQIHNSRALAQELVSCGKLDSKLGKLNFAVKYMERALEIVKITDGEGTPLYVIIKGLIGDIQLKMPKYMRRK